MAATTLLLLLSVGNFIYAFSLFVVFYTFTDDSHNVQPFLHTVDVEFGIGAVAAEYLYCLQTEQLFQNVTVLAEIHHSVQLDVVTGSGQYSMLDDELFGGDDVSEFVEI